MLSLSQTACVAIAIALSVTTASFAQTTTKLSPGEMAAMDAVKAEKTAACRAQAKEQKLSLTKRRAFVKACVAKALGTAPVVLMRGHGFNAVGSSIRQAVFRAVYTDLNARILADALRMGSVTTLNESEARKVAETNDAALDRSWEVWRFKALANTPKL